MTGKNLPPPGFLRVTAAMTGAVGVFHLYADDELFREKLDSRLCNRSGKVLYDNMIGVGEIRYGWLFSSAREALDEVLLARPHPGMRVLMCHGGMFICQGIIDFLTGLGFEDWRDAVGRCPEQVDRVVNTLLANSITETQAAAVLAGMEQLRRGGEMRLPDDLFMTHHLCLGGAPNAGKSSLLNRLVGYERAFVHSLAGATRDTVGELVDIAGYSVLVEDLPGFFGAASGLQAEALARAEERFRLATAVAFVCDASAGWDASTEMAAKKIHDLMEKNGLSTVSAIVVLNKCDRGNVVSGEPWRLYFADPVLVETNSLPGGDAAEKFSRAFFRLMRAKREGERLG